MRKKDSNPQRPEPAAPRQALRGAGAAARKRPNAVLSSDDIFERLLGAITEHRLAPGTQLVEARLASIFKVSRTKVREAIGRLVHDRIATSIPNRGAFVSSPSVADARDVFAARALIEPALVRLAASKADADQIAELRRHLAREAQARDRGDQRQIVALSGEFHFLVADIAGNSFLARTLRELETLTSLIIILFGTPTHTACPADHPALVDAIEKHDAERAATLMRAHLAHVEQAVALHAPEPVAPSLEAIFA